MPHSPRWKSLTFKAQCDILRAAAPDRRGQPHPSECLVEIAHRLGLLGDREAEAMYATVLTAERALDDAKARAHALVLRKFEGDIRTVQAEASAAAASKDAEPPPFEKAREAFGLERLPSYEERCRAYEEHHRACDEAEGMLVAGHVERACLEGERGEEDDITWAKKEAARLAVLDNEIKRVMDVMNATLKKRDAEMQRRMDAAMAPHDAETKRLMEAAMTTQKGRSPF